MKLRILSLLLAVGALASACGDDDNGSGPSTSGRVRFVHLSPEAPAVDVLIDDVAVETDMIYLDASEYQDVEAGTRNVAIRESDTDEALVDEDVTVVDGEDYTVLLGGDFFGTLTLDALTDDNSAPSSGNAKVRLIHAAPGADVVDVYVTAPGADLTGEIPIAPGIVPGTVSPYFPVPAGDYQLRITTSGTTDVLIDTGTITLAEGQVRTGIAVDAPGGGAPFGALILEDAN